MKTLPTLYHSEFLFDFPEIAQNFPQFIIFIDHFRSGNISESEYEDDENNEVVLPQTLNSRGNLANNKSAIRLHEIGPRLTIELIKIQNDLFTGEVLYHNAIVKTEKEIAEIKKARDEKKRLKELRKKIQNENVVKKEKHKDEHKKRSLAGIPKSEVEQANEEEHVDDDADYYREAVGEEPDDGKTKIIIKFANINQKHNFNAISHFNCSTDLFHKASASTGRKRPFVPKHMKRGNEKDAKRRKIDNGTEKGAKQFNKSEVKNPKKDFKQKGAKKPDSEVNKNANKLSAKKVKKTKSKKPKSKKKTQRNKNK